MSTSQRVIDRISALLAKAERTDHPEEAAAYLAKAQSLATQSSVDLAMARARTARREEREQPTQRTITIGERGKRANTHLVTLYVSVGRCNELQIDVAHNSTYVIAYGMPSDIDLTTALFASLATQMTASATSWLALGAWRQDSYLSREGFAKPHTAQTARTAFYQAFIDRIAKRLQQARDEVIDRIKNESVPVAPDVSASGQTTGALVLRSKEKEVRHFYQSTSSARGSWSGYSGSMTRHGGAAARAGRTAGDQARLARAREISQGAGAIGE